MTCLTLMTHGEGGHGKSTLFETAPGPRLLIDSENKSGLLEGKMVDWSDLSVCPSLEEDTTYVLRCASYRDVTNIVKLLNRHGSKFKSFGVDSWSRLQQHLGAELTAKGVDGWAFWGDLKSQTLLLLDCLAGLAEAHASVVYGTCWMHLRDEKNRPLLEGAIKDMIGHYYIVVGRPLLRFSNTGITQELHIFPGKMEEEVQETEAKTNSMTLLKHYGKVIQNPDLTEIYKVLNKQITNTGEQ